MNILKNFALGALLATTTLVSTSLLAQPAMDMSGMKEKGMSMEMSNGEVKKIDIEAQKITLKHGEIKSMDMPGMTMVFRTQDPSLLDNLKVGDKVKFNAEKREGFIVVTAIEAIK
ncbi:copper-binding protein [Polaromonas sp.]|uniref:copper-binding protein n=1 Tax=Polaromonas sp. TaxID=1869339 RepID=UPI001D5F09F1|nr:copper-binding protein [Polaromonas sp.]MBT9475911.1 copper-binding protein [Polaromonas sp.]